MSREIDSLLNVFPEPIVVVSADAVIQSANKAFFAFTETGANQIAGRSISHIMGTDESAFRDIIERCCRTSAPLPFAAHRRTSQGEFVRCRVRGALLQQGDSKSSTTVWLRMSPHVSATQGFQKLNEEVSALKREILARQKAEAEVRDREARYRDLIHALPGAIYTCDERGRVTLFNQAAVDLWGREPEVGKDLWCGSWKIYSLDGTPLPLHEYPMAVMLHEGRAIRGHEIIIKRPDGTRRHVLTHPEPMRNAEGVLVGAINMLVDITQQKKAELGVAHLASIVTSSSDSILGVDLSGIVTSWNRATEAFYGYAAHEIIGQPLGV